MQNKLSANCVLRFVINGRYRLFQSQGVCELTRTHSPHLHAHKCTAIQLASQPARKQASNNSENSKDEVYTVEREKIATKCIFHVLYSLFIQNETFVAVFFSLAVLLFIRFAGAFFALLSFDSFLFLFSTVLFFFSFSFCLVRFVLLCRAVIARFAFAFVCRFTFGDAARNITYAKSRPF